MDRFLEHLSAKLEGLHEQGLYHPERVIASKQAAEIAVISGQRVLNFCSNNYLGLANNPALIETAKAALDRYGYGMASVRFICGTQEEHRQLEQRLAVFLGKEEAILYSSGFDANTGLFAALLEEEDAVIGDALNRASIVDGIRLCKARRFQYANNNMAELERCLKEAADARFRLIATDGVFSMDGIFANLPDICDLAERHDAMVLVDDSHAVGFVGPRGRGTAAAFGVADRVDIMTGTLGKALGGATGGYASASRPVTEWLRQRSRPYLYSNSIAPVIAATTLRVLSMVEAGDELRARLYENARIFRDGMTKLGFTLAGADHPIIPVMLGDAALAKRMADKMLARGVYVIAFSYPVVPMGTARIRVQMSAVHEQEEVERCIETFAEVGRELGVIS